MSNHSPTKLINTCTNTNTHTHTHHTTHTHAHMHPRTHTHVHVLNACTQNTRTRTNTLMHPSTHTHAKTLAGGRGGAAREGECLVKIQSLRTKKKKQSLAVRLFSSSDPIHIPLMQSTFGAICPKDLKKIDCSNPSSLSLCTLTSEAGAVHTYVFSLSLST